MITDELDSETVTQVFDEIFRNGVKDITYDSADPDEEGIGIVDKWWGMPLIGVADPLGGGDESLWENLPLLSFMALLMEQTS